LSEGRHRVADLPALVAGLAKPRAVWVMLPAGAPTEDTINTLSSLLEAGDTIIDGGNTFYKDDIRRAKTLAGKRPALHRRRHFRRRLGPGARLLHDDRRRCRDRERLDPLFAAWRRAWATFRAPRTAIR
jgi:hypothetical protein